jgi:hypothetical protein
MITNHHSNKWQVANDYSSNRNQTFFNSCDIHNWISWTIIKDVLFYFLIYNIGTNINEFGVDSPTKTSLRK